MKVKAVKTYKVRLKKDEIENMAQLIAVGNWFVNSVRVPGWNEGKFQTAADNFITLYETAFPEAKPEIKRLNKDAEEYLCDLMTPYIDFYNAEIIRKKGAE